MMKQPATGNPLPTTLEDALVEVVTLQRMLVEANKKIAKKWEKHVLVERGLKYDLKFARKCLSELLVWAEWQRKRRGSPAMNEPNTGATDAARRYLGLTE